MFPNHKLYYFNHTCLWAYLSKKWAQNSDKLILILEVSLNTWSNLRSPCTKGCFPWQQRNRDRYIKRHIVVASWYNNTFKSPLLHGLK
jgi:hypothetical protein